MLGAGTGQHPYLTREECGQLYELGAGRIDGRCKLVCQTCGVRATHVVKDRPGGCTCHPRRVFTLYVRLALAGALAFGALYDLLLR